MRKGTGKGSGSYQANNAGGYGNPPVRHQFKPGGVGGPGRTKGETTLEAAMRKMFGGTVQVTSNGESREVSMVQALAERAKKEFLTGSARSLELGIELALKYGPKEGKVDDVPVADFTMVDPDQQRALRDLFNGVEYVDRHELRRLQQLDDRMRKNKE